MRQHVRRVGLGVKGMNAFAPYVDPESNSRHSPGRNAMFRRAVPTARFPGEKHHLELTYTALHIVWGDPVRARARDGRIEGSRPRMQMTSTN